MADEGLSADRLKRVLRFARRLALEHDPETARAALVQFTLEVITGDAAALVVRQAAGDLFVHAHFGAAMQAMEPEVMRVASQVIGSGRAVLHQPDEDRRIARPELGRIAAAPLRLGSRRAALVLTRLYTAAELHEVCLGPLWLIASLASEVLRRTESERARSALEHHIDALGDEATHAAILLDPGGRIVRANGKAASLLGARPDVLHDHDINTVAGASAIAAAWRAHGSERQDLPIQHGRTTRTLRIRPHPHGCVLVLQDPKQDAPTQHRARYTFEDLVTQDPVVLQALDAARHTAQRDVPILLTGESGTGKEVLAQAIHAASPRSHEPFVAVNVAAIPSELLESELFGYEAGAFTGARDRGKPGAFEQAGRGTLLLDEVGEMPVAMQAKLLRVLQERQVQRLGATVPTPVHARVLATTNRDLQERVAEGRFRLDLYYRLRVVSIELPALRKRPNDVPLLAQHFLEQICSQLDRPPVEISAAVLDQLVHHPWPGNIRELSNLLLGVVSLLPDQVRVIDELPVFLTQPNLTPLAPPSRVTAPPSRIAGPTGRRRTPGHPLAEPEPEETLTLAEVERRAIEQALVRTDRNFSQASRLLGCSRTTLYKKVKDYGL